MSFTKVYTKPDQTSGDHWVVEQMNFSVSENKLSIRFGVYKDAAAKASGAKALANLSATLTISTAVPTLDDIISDCEDLLIAEQGKAWSGGVKN